MIIGSVLERGNWKYIVLFVPLWIVFVYAPICLSLWGHGNWLGKMGVLDYSGGLVVHTTAGIGSLVLAITSPIRLKNSLIFKSQEMIAFVGMLFITFSYILITENGEVLLNDFDESTIAKNIFLTGPNVRKGNTIFCYIYINFAKVLP